MGCKYSSNRSSSGLWGLSAEYTDAKRNDPREQWREEMLQHMSGAEVSETETEPEETPTQKLLDWWGDPNPKKYNAHTVRGILLFVKYAFKRSIAAVGCMKTVMWCA